MPEHTIIVGSRFRLEWAVGKNGDAPARTFFETLKPKEKAQILALFKRLADHGRIDNRQQFKRLNRNLWEFKKFQLRFLGDYRAGGRFLVALGVRKKKDKHSRKDLEKAERILKEADLSEGDHR